MWPERKLEGGDEKIAHKKLWWWMLLVRSFYMFLHTQGLQRSLYTESSNTQARLQTDTFTQRSFYTESFYTRKLSHTQKFYTKKSLHREAFTRRSFFTQKFLTQRSLWETFTKRSFYTRAFTHRSCYTQMLFHSHVLGILQQETTLQTETRRQCGPKESWREETRR